MTCKDKIECPHKAARLLISFSKKQGIRYGFRISSVVMGDLTRTRKKTPEEIMEGEKREHLKAQQLRGDLTQ